LTLDSSVVVLSLAESSTRTRGCRLEKVAAGAAGVDSVCGVICFVAPKNPDVVITAITLSGG
jgi:hypothetical protein